MVYDEVGWNERVDPARIAPHVRHRAPHRCEVDDRWHTGEVLHDNPGGQVRKLSADRLGPYGQHVPVHILIQGLQAIEFYISGTSLQRRARTEGIVRHLRNLFSEIRIPDSARL